MNVPAPRGPLSAAVFAALGGPPRALPPFDPATPPRSADFQITLWVLQELRFRRLDGVAADWEDAPAVVALRNDLERAQERELRRELPTTTVVASDLVAEIHSLLDRESGPSLSRWMMDHGTLFHLREFAMHRAAYQLKEADPHSFAIPRMAPGKAKSALLKIQLDEYGNAEPGQSHAELFADTLRALDVRLDLDALPATTLRTNTVLNMLAARRRTLGACVGHLAVFEMTSVEPMARYAAALRRVLPAAEATVAARFYDVHVAADGFHEQLAAAGLLTGFADRHPDEVGEVLFGAQALLAVEREFASHLLQSWEAGRSSLWRPETARAA